MARYLETHLASRDVARVVYGSIIGLALVVALEKHPPTATQTVGALLGTAVAVALAELYSEVVGAEARTRRHVDRARLEEFARDSGWVALGAGFPALFFILAAFGAFDVEDAFRWSKWTGVVLICAYGFVGARLSGSGRGAALGQAVAVGAIGGFLIALKALLH